MAEIQVTGVGRVSVVPDQSVVNVHARHLAPTAREALEGAAALAREAMDVLEAAGVDEDDRGGSPSGIHKETRWQDEREVLLGWSATYQVHATIRDVELAYQVIENLSEVEGVDTNGPQWQIAHDNPAHSEARHAAVADAQLKAVDLAEAAGLELGALLHVSDSSAGPSEGPMRALHTLADESSSGGSMDPGTREVRATASLTFVAVPKE